MTPEELLGGFRALEAFSLGDLEAAWTVLRGDSVIDWKRLHFASRSEVDEFLRVQGFHPDDPGDQGRMEAIKTEAIGYLRRHFEYPIPRSLSQSSVEDILLLASGKGHKQLCACVILKVMHIIHHLQGRELLFMLPMSDAEVFHLVEEKVYRVLGGMLSSGLPITEFLGGRKGRDSLYTKLLSKSETIAAQMYDKIRFRIVTRTVDDILPVLNFLSRRLFPFNYVIPGESTNTLLEPRALAARHPHIADLLASKRINVPLDLTTGVDNRFSAPSYRVIHFVVDLPVRIPAKALLQSPPSAWPLGPVAFMLTEFQICDQDSEHANEAGDASHSRYKDRQRLAVKNRLRLGAPTPTIRRTTRPPSQK